MGLEKFNLPLNPMFRALSDPDGKRDSTAASTEGSVEASLDFQAESS
jgi:hypothetical protein